MYLFISLIIKKNRLNSSQKLLSLFCYYLFVENQKRFILKFQDPTPPPPQGDVQTSRNWEFSDLQRNRNPKNDKLPLVPNIELESSKDFVL